MMKQSWLAALVAATGALALTPNWQFSDALETRDDLVVRTAADFVTKCKAKLSPGALVYVPGEPQFALETIRWDEYAAPNITVVVEVATEKDVAETVRAANRCRMPFLAYSGGHGATTTLAAAKNTVEIYMRRLNSVTVSSDGNSANIGGGTLSGEIVRALFAKNKWTTTGACDCTGVVAPMLGGGHGWLQGQYGLVADNMISANVVLDIGVSITVSASKFSDLYYGLKGAGHNFGIVTSFNQKIYPVTQPNWAYETFIFKQDKLEQLYTQLNSLAPKQPKELVQFSYFLNLPALDPTNPVIFLYMLYSGSAADLSPYAAPFRTLGAISDMQGVTDYPGISTLTQNGDSSPACQKGRSWQRWPASLSSYNVPVVRQAYQQFKQLTTDQPATVNSIFLWEGYSTQAVKAVPSDSTAYAFRSDNLLVSAAINYVSDPALDPIVGAWGTNVRNILVQGSGAPLHSYVNYAHGDESLQANFGYESYRVPKLQQLKKKYDPFRKFSFYEPIS